MGIERAEKWKRSKCVACEEEGALNRAGSILWWIRGGSWEMVLSCATVCICVYTVIYVNTHTYAKSWWWGLQRIWQWPFRLPLLCPCKCKCSLWRAITVPVIHHPSPWLSTASVTQPVHISEGMWESWRWNSIEHKASNKLLFLPLLIIYFYSIFHPKVFWFFFSMLTELCYFFIHSEEQSIVHKIV